MKDTQPADILIVDDELTNLQVLVELLDAQGYHTRAALNGSLALRAARTAAPDLILLDIMMPDMDGYEVCTALKADAGLVDVPVVFLSALEATADKVRAFAVGGVDYITKPFEVEEVLARVETHLALRNAQKHLEQANAKLVRKIAERKRAEEELQRTKELLEQTSRIARVGGWEKDLLTGGDNWSDMTREIHEVPDDFVPDMQSGINFYKEGQSRDKITQVVTRTIEQGEPFDVELQIVTAKGNERWVRAIGHPEFQDGQCVRLYGIFQDIDDQVQAANALRESEQRFRSVVEFTSDAIINADSSGTIIYWNKAAEKVFGYSPDKIIGQSLSIIMPDRVREMFKVGLEQMISSEKSELFGRTLDVFGLRKDGSEFPVEVTYSAWESKEGLVFTGINRDITERKRTEETLHQYTARLEALREVGLELAAQLDLDTLLHSIAARAVELLDGTDGGAYLYRPKLDALESVVDM
ncbi:MAG: PAS domain S-box protein, partial [Chloroflexi bacterium]|nr:PAS domain S-box protein [Chloroflexota bacterium]